MKFTLRIKKSKTFKYILKKGKYYTRRIFNYTCV